MLKERILQLSRVPRHSHTRTCSPCKAETRGTCVPENGIKQALATLVMGLQDTTLFKTFIGVSDSAAFRRNLPQFKRQKQKL